MNSSRTKEVEAFLHSCACRFPAPHIPISANYLDGAPDDVSYCERYISSKLSHQLALDIHLCHYSTCLLMFSPASFVSILPIYMYNAILHLDDGELAGLSYRTIYKRLLEIKPTDIDRGTIDSDRECISQLLLLAIDYFEILKQNGFLPRAGIYCTNLRSKHLALAGGS